MQEKRSFLAALGDFLALATLEIVEPKRIKGKARNEVMYHPIEERLSSMMWASASVTTAVSFTPSRRRVLTEIDAPKRVEAERVMAQLDERGRLHSFDNAPAIVFPDGTAKHYWHGVHVPEYVVREPQLITAKGIDEEENQEIRRVMVERFGGIQKYLEQCKAKLVSSDEFGELYERDIAPDATWESLRFVKVKNSTAEPDGSFKDYFLRVPPRVKTPQEGIAWTFNLDGNAYIPELQT